MKIALPSKNNKIDDHFGHCDYFTVLTVDKEAKKIIKSETLEAPEGCGCKSNIASTLKEMGVTTMLAGNMGNGAVNVLNNAGIDVLRGCTGEVTAVAEKWLEDALVDSGDNCNHHDCKH